MTHLLFLDIESTGLNSETDEIIEVGAILTDERLFEVAHYEAVVVPTSETIKKLAANRFVLNMHRKNGLLDVLLDVLERGDMDGLPPEGVKYLGQIERDLTDLILRLVPADGKGKRTVHLAGSGVAAFDFPFLRKHMPYLATGLHYAPIDVGPSRRLWQWTTGTELTADNSAKNHRAMDDVKGHLREARAIRGHFESAFIDE